MICDICKRKFQDNSNNLVYSICREKLNETKKISKKINSNYQKNISDNPNDDITRKIRLSPEKLLKRITI